MSRYLRVLLTSVWICACVSVEAAAEGARLQRVQQLYLQAEQAGLAAPYSAPLPWEAQGPHYLLGGLDIIEVLRHYRAMQTLQPGSPVYVHKRELFGTTVVLQTEAGAMLFRSAENLQEYLRQPIVVLLGGNCLQGVIAGMATRHWPSPVPPHWAPPTLAAIIVEEVDGVTYVGLNVAYAAVWWQTNPARWQQAEDALTQLLVTQQPWPVWRAHYHMWTFFRPED
jgi:hypothetical protein